MPHKVTHHGTHVQGPQGYPHHTSNGGLHANTRID